jgi:hypothetical protein
VTAAVVVVVEEVAMVVAAAAVVAVSLAEEEWRQSSGHRVRYSPFRENKCRSCGSAKSTTGGSEVVVVGLEVGAAASAFDDSAAF